MNQIVVSGFGGQGVLSLGLLLSYTAMKENRNTSFLPSYGPEMRGGTANCSVVISEKEVASPVISRPDILVAFNEPSLARFLPAVAEGGRVFVDADTTDERYTSLANVTAVPLGRLCGAYHKGQNIAMFGAVLLCTGMRYESGEEAVRQTFARKPQFLEDNLRCLQAGYAWAQKAGL